MKHIFIKILKILHSLNKLVIPSVTKWSRGISFPQLEVCDPSAHQLSGFGRDDKIAKLYKNKCLNSQGNALITLVFFTVIAITIITASALVLSANLLSTSSVEQGTQAYYNAESGAENGMLSILRNPQITGTQTMTFDNGTASVNINPTPDVIISTGTSGKSTRTVKVITSHDPDGIHITSWQEVPNP